MVSYAESLGKPWVAVHVQVRPEKTEQVLAKWGKYLGRYGPLYVLPSPYRSLTRPVVHLVQEIKKHHPDAFVNIILAQLVTESLLGQVLHRNSGPLFKFAFQRLRGVAVTDVHYRIAGDRDDQDDGNTQSGPQGVQPTPTSRHAADGAGSADGVPEPAAYRISR
jgi:hypothetical protein